MIASINVSIRMCEIVFRALVRKIISLSHTRMHEDVKLNATHEY